MLAARTNLLRGRREHEHHRVTFVELFFDLVFVFAVTQLSHGLLKHLTLLGLVQAVVLVLGVWWLWMYTTWSTNWLDPDKPAVRLMLFALMLAALVLASSTPKAFEERGSAFALAYVFIQLGRTGFMLWALKRHDARNFQNFTRISSYGSPRPHRSGSPAHSSIVLHASVFGASRSRSNIFLLPSISGCRASVAPPPPTGISKAPIWPSAACSSSSRSAPTAAVATPLLLSAGATAILIVVAVWEWCSLRGRVTAAAHS